MPAEKNINSQSTLVEKPGNKTRVTPNKILFTYYVYIRVRQNGLKGVEIHKENDGMNQINGVRQTTERNPETGREKFVYQT